MDNKKIKKENIKKKKLFVSTLKERIILVLSLNFALTFMIFIFSPIDVFLRNQKDFGIGVFDALLPLIIAGLLFFIVTSLIMLFIGEKLFKVFSALALGLLMASYIQILFLNGNMVAFTGDMVDYSEKTMSNYINTFLFFFILFLPLIFILLKKLFPNNKILAFSKGKIITYLSAFIFTMQVCGIIGTIFSVGLNNIQVKRQNLNYKFSYENLLNLSKNNNITVFLVDRLDGDYFDEFLNEYPEMKDELSGFTYYRNNIACYTNTFPSVPEMLTNSKHIGGENSKDYLEKAWKSHSLTDILHENNYNVNLIIDKSTSYREVDDLFGEVDNIKEADQNYKVNYIRDDGILEIMLKISFGKLSPYFNKNFFLDEIKPDFSNNFIIYNTSKVNVLDSISYDYDFVDDVISFTSDIKFYDYIKKYKLNNKGKKTFNFIHLNGAHGTSKDISRLYDDSIESSSKNSTIRGEFAIILEYIEQMKQLGIYDNSTIFILGDHGHPPLEIEYDKKDHLDAPIITALLIKPQNPELVPLITNNEAELSNANLIKSILDCAGINVEGDEYEPSYFDIINNNLHPVRNIYIRYLSYTPICRYEVTGDARDFNNWKHFKDD